MICPIRKQECTRAPQCKPEHQDQGNTFCAEWVLKEQIQGRAELESNTKTRVGERRKHPSS